MKTAELVVQDVSKQFVQGRVQIDVLKNVSISFVQGNTYAIIGVSGTGKSTFMHILAGLDVPTTGVVLFNERALHTYSANEHATFLNQSIGLVFQSPYLLRELSVIENIMLPGLIAGKGQALIKKKAQKLLAQVGITDKMYSKPSALSGGQQQRVALARALCNEPVFLLADEPTGNLDIETGKVIIDLLLACQKEWGMCVIVTSHDPYVAQTMAEVYQLAGGSLTRKKL